MTYFTYIQNNSGGRFVRNDDVAEVVIIEAKDRDAADAKAEDIGIYFNGCDDGHDCSCCGDRWDPAGSWDAHEVPTVYSETDLQKYVDDKDTLFNKAIYVYHENGNVDRYISKK